MTSKSDRLSDARTTADRPSAHLHIAEEMTMNDDLTIIGLDRIEDKLMVTFSDESVALFTAGELLSLAPHRYTREELEVLLQVNEED